MQHAVRMYPSFAIIVADVRLKHHVQDWEDLADLDLYWSILSDPRKQFGGWRVDEFFHSGEAEVDRLRGKVERLGVPLLRSAALDFGCGAGRVTRALAKHFKEVVGVDISARMIDAARELNDDVPNCTFVLNRSDDLGIFEAGSFDLVYTSNVLQHLPSRAIILATISELVRTLAPGGLLIFQIATFIPRSHRLQPRRRVYGALRKAGVPPRFLYTKLRLQPIRMTFLSEGAVADHLASAGARVLEVEKVLDKTGSRSAAYYTTR